MNHLHLGSADARAKGAFCFRNPKSDVGISVARRHRRCPPLGLMTMRDPDQSDRYIVAQIRKAGRGSSDHSVSRNSPTSTRSLLANPRPHVPLRLSLRRRLCPPIRLRARNRVVVSVGLATPKASDISKLSVPNSRSIENRILTRSPGSAVS